MLHTIVHKSAGQTGLSYKQTGGGLWRGAFISNGRTMGMGDYQKQCRDYERVETAIRYIENHHAAQPGLTEIARAAQMSDYHFQRLFSRWVGISPKRFLQFLTKEHAKNLIRESGTVLDTTFDSGLSSPGRLHDLFVNCEAVTPGEYKKKGLGLEIRYGFHPSPFGECLLAVTDRGLCGLTFVQNGDREQPLADLKRQWPQAAIRIDPQASAGLLDRIFGYPHDHRSIFSSREPTSRSRSGRRF